VGCQARPIHDAGNHRANGASSIHQPARRGVLIKQARTEHHGDDQRQIHHSTRHYLRHVLAGCSFAKSWLSADVLVGYAGPGSGHSMVWFHSGLWPLLEHSQDVTARIIVRDWPEDLLPFENLVVGGRNHGRRALETEWPERQPEASP
jgi:hypothetical protein